MLLAQKASTPSRLGQVADAARYFLGGSRAQWSACVQPESAGRLRMVVHARGTASPHRGAGLKLGETYQSDCTAEDLATILLIAPERGAAGRHAGATDLTRASASLAAVTPFLLITATVAWEGFGESPWEPVGRLGVGRRGSMVTWRQWSVDSRGDMPL